MSNEIEQMEKDFAESELAETNIVESEKTFTNDVELLNSSYSKEDLKGIAEYLEKETIGVHLWVKNTPVIVKVLSECEFTKSNKIEQFNALVSMRVNGKLVSKNAKINVVAGMRTQFKKHMKCFIKNTKKVNFEDITYRKKINGHIFGMNYTGLSDSKLFKDSITGLPVKTKSIVVRLLG